MNIFKLIALILFIVTPSIYAQADLSTPNPFEELQHRYQEAVKNGAYAPEDAILATVDKDGQPAARVVSVRKIDPQQGIVFFTNPNSEKVKHFSNNPKVAMVFYWPKGSHAQQIIVKGTIQPLNEIYNYTSQAGKNIPWKGYSIVPNYFQFSDVNLEHAIGESQNIAFQLENNKWQKITSHYEIPQFYKKAEQKIICRGSIDCVPQH